MQVRSYSFEQSLFGQVGRLASQVERQLETALKVRYSLTFSQFRVLSALARLGETSQRPLVDELGLSAALITRQLDALVGRGLVEQKQNPVSRRENVVQVTKKGERAVAEIGKDIQAYQAQLLKDLDLEDETTLQRLLEKLVQDIK